MTRLLRAVNRAARRRADAEHAYRAAIIEARNAGHTLADIGRAAGITKQGAYKLLNPKRKT